MVGRDAVAEVQSPVILEFSKVRWEGWCGQNFRHVMRLGGRPTLLGRPTSNGLFKLQTFSFDFLSKLSRWLTCHPRSVKACTMVSNPQIQITHLQLAHAYLMMIHLLLISGTSYVRTFGFSELKLTSDLFALYSASNQTFVRFRTLLTRSLQVPQIR